MKKGINKEDLIDLIEILFDDNKALELGERYLANEHRDLEENMIRIKSNLSELHLNFKGCGIDRLLQMQKLNGVLANLNEMLEKLIKDCKKVYKN